MVMRSSHSQSELLGTRSKSPRDIKIQIRVNSIQRGLINAPQFYVGLGGGSTRMVKEELCEASEGFSERFFPSVRAQLVGETGQSFSTICIIIPKEVGASVFVLFFFPPLQSSSHPSHCSGNSRRLRSYCECLWGTYLRFVGGVTQRRIRTSKQLKNDLREQIEIASPSNTKRKK